MPDGGTARRRLINISLAMKKWYSKHVEVASKITFVYIFKFQLKICTGLRYYTIVFLYFIL